MPNPEEVFEHHFPDGVEAGETYRILCDDKGRNEKCWLEVTIAMDGDVYVTTADYESLESKAHPTPSVRKRTGTGGGKDQRTHQAILWLAEAIRRDNQDEY